MRLRLSDIGWNQLEGLTHEEALRIMARLGIAPMRGGEDENDEDENDDDAGDEDGDEDDSQNRGRRTDKPNVEAIVSRRLKSKIPKLRSEIEAQIRREMEEDRAEKDKDLSAQLRIANEKLRDFDAMNAALEAMTDAAEARYEAALEDLPETVLAFAPDEDDDIITKIDWLEKKAIPMARKLAKQTGDDDDDSSSKKSSNGTTKKAATRGFNPRDPKTKGAEKEADRVEKIVSKFRKSGHYVKM